MRVAARFCSQCSCTAALVFLSGVFRTRATDYIQLAPVGDWKRTPSPEQGASDARDVQVIGDTAFIADANFGLEVVDVTDRSNPRWMAGHDSGIGWRLSVRDSLVYLSDLSAGWVVVDVPNPTQANVVGGYSSSGFPGGMAFRDSFAYLAYGTNGLHVLDLTDPRKPRFVGRCDVPGEALDVALWDDKAFVVNSTGTLSVVAAVDISVEPPTLLDRITAGGYATKLLVEDGIAYLAAGASGLLIMDVRNPQDRRTIGTWQEDCIVHNLTLSGHYLYLSGGRCGSDTVAGMLRVLDITDPAQPVRVGGRDSVHGARGLAISGEYLYVASEHEGLQIFEINASPFLEVTSYRDGDLSLRWSTPGTGYVLERSENLIDPLWQAIPGTGNVNDTNLPITGASGFYRLSRTNAVQGSFSAD